MKLIIFIILSSFCVNVYSKYLDNLDRPFDKIENKIVDIYISLTDEEFKQLEKSTQVTLEQVQTNNPESIGDFEAIVNCTVIYDGKEEFRPLTKFKTGGMYARSNTKVGYNLKFEDKIFTRKSLRLRPDPNDKTYMREKLTADILNRAGLPSVQSSYARLYINNNFFGLYFLLDSVKPFMIKILFKLDDKSEDMTLFQCKNSYMDFTLGSETHCIDANNKTSTDLSKLADFVKNVNEATSIEQFDEFLDVDLFLKSVIIEWLIGSFDHFLIFGHNFNLYKRPADNKWCMILYDFDNTFGLNLDSGLFKLPESSIPYDYHTLSFKDFNSNVNHKIFQYLIYKDNTRFKKNLIDILVYAFNPVILDEHIKDLREFLLPYVIEDLTPIDGVLPGRINKVGVLSGVTINDFKTTNELMDYIQKRYNAVISEYKMDRFEIETLATTEKPTSYFSTSTVQKKEMENKLYSSRFIGFISRDKGNVHYIDGEENSEIIKNCLKCEKKEGKIKKYCKKCPALKIINNLKILTPNETLDEIIYNNKSITRFGDVEFELIFGMDKINFQKTNKNITIRLKEILNSNEEDLLIGLWNGIQKNYRKLYRKGAKRFWRWWTNENKYKLISLLDLNKTYGSTTMSRFYYNYKDRSHVKEYVKKFKMIWDKKDIVMIEGEKTRLGVGNDLFDNAKSIQRILCPNSNAFDLYNEIYKEALKIDKNKLIVLALGPTATILAYDLYKAGYQAVDIGHVDIEYEWFLRNATRKIQIDNKHTYEAINKNNNFDDLSKNDPYTKQIIIKILH